MLEYVIVELVLVCHVFNGFVKLVHNISLSAPFGFLVCSYLFVASVQFSCIYKQKIPLDFSFATRQGSAISTQDY
jgi:hypothetical protein